MLAATALDPSFGIGGALLIAPDRSQSQTSTAVTALAVQSDGKIVTAESPYSITDTNNYSTLLVRRFLPNGAVDTSFGTGGTTTIPLSTPTTQQASTAPRNLVITSNGQILLAAEFETQAGVRQDLVVRLTSAGALDTTFGTGGEATLPSNVQGVNSVAVASSGRILTVGSTPFVSADDYPKPVVVGLTSTGALDTTFGTGGETVLPLATAALQGQISPSVNVVGLQTTPSGQIVVGIQSFGLRSVVPPGRYSQYATLSRLSADGTIDTTFGTGGTQSLDSILADFAAFAVAPDGRIVVGGVGATPLGTTNSLPNLVRLTTTGAVDPTFTLSTNARGLGGYTALAVAADGSVTTVQSFSVARFSSTGTLQAQLGRGGRIPTNISAPVLATTGPGLDTNFLIGRSVALTSSGNVLVAGVFNSDSIVAQYRPVLLPQILNFFSYDPNKTQSALAAELTTTGQFAYRADLGTPDGISLFGPTGAGQSIPAPGDYDGDGTSDPALYLPSLGILAYRPSTGGADVLTRFGPTGVGSAVPVPGDYDGDGRTDVALFLPGSATFIVDPSGGGAPYAVQFGSPGSGNSIPAPGDYDGSGKTELAVFLPGPGILAYRSARTNTDTYVRFGPTGVGSAVPVAGDFDGDGRTDVALYLPGSSTFAIDPSGGGAPYAVTFGIAGAGNSVPVPADYDGDGEADIAVFLPGTATYAIRPSNGTAPFAEQFGVAGAGNTLPATTVVPSPSTVTTKSLALTNPPDAASAVPVYLPTDLGEPATPNRKPRT